MKLKGMDFVLLVGLEESSSLYAVSTFAAKPFKVWEDQDGIDLFWRGRRVDRIYSLGKSYDYWQELSLYDTITMLLERGKAERVKYMPVPEGGLPS